MHCVCTVSREYKLMLGLEGLNDTIVFVFCILRSGLAFVVTTHIASAHISFFMLHDIRLWVVMQWLVGLNNRNYNMAVGP